MKLEHVLWFFLLLSITKSTLSYASSTPTRESFWGSNISNLDDHHQTIGLTHVILEKGLSFKSQAVKPNTIYEIRYDFDLREGNKNGVVEIPEGCVLEFKGGSLKNGIVTGRNTIISAGLVRIFGDALSLAGTWKMTESYPQWFGAFGNGIDDDTEAILKTINTFSKIVFVKGTYLFSSALEIGSDKTISGAEENQNNGNVILKTKRNITCLKMMGNGITIDNITIEHPETNTAPVIDFTGYRYINLRNIICHHYGKPCPAIGLYSGNSLWTGYDVFENCYFSQYSENVRIENGSFVSFYNCKLNNATKRHLFLGGSVFSFINCDITKSPNDKTLGIEYTGQYTVDFVGCYLEGFRLTDFAKCTNKSLGAGVRISGSKYYLPNASGRYPSSTAYAEYEDMTYFSPDMLPRFSNGFHRTVNKIVNGDFGSDFVWWQKTSNVSDAIITNNVTLPKGQMSGRLFERTGKYPGEVWQRVGNLSQGTHTIGMWIQANEIYPDFRIDIIVSDGRGVNAYKALSFVTKNEKYKNWQYVTCLFDIPQEKLNSDWYARVVFAGCKAIKLTGVTLYDGVYTEAGAGNSLSEDIVLTKELIIKGADDKYYKISVDENGMVKATLVD